MRLKGVTYCDWGYHVAPSGWTQIDLAYYSMDPEQIEAIKTAIRWKWIGLT